MSADMHRRHVTLKCRCRSRHLYTLRQVLLNGHVVLAEAGHLNAPTGYSLAIPVAAWGEDGVHVHQQLAVADAAAVALDGLDEGERGGSGGRARACT